VEERLVGPNSSDFWVELPRQDDRNLTTIIELKVAKKSYGSAQLVDPIESQLWERYMEPVGCTHGIHVVLWFKDKDRFPHPSRWASADALLADLEDKGIAVAEERHVRIAVRVLDLTARPRR